MGKNFPQTMRHGSPGPFQAVFIVMLAQSEQRGARFAGWYQPEPQPGTVITAMDFLPAGGVPSDYNLNIRC